MMSLKTLSSKLRWKCRPCRIRSVRTTVPTVFVIQLSSPTVTRWSTSTRSPGDNSSNRSAPRWELQSSAGKHRGQSFPLPLYAAPNPHCSPEDCKKGNPPTHLFARILDTSFALIQDISRRRPRPTCSTKWFRSRRRRALNDGALALFSRIHSRAKLAVLDFPQNPLHFRLGLGGDDPRPAGVVAVFGGVGNAVAHVVQAALVDQIDDQLQLVDALEIGHFRLVAGLDEGLKAGLDQGADAAAEDDLLAEQIGFGFFGEGGFDDARPGAADALA